MMDRYCTLHFALLTSFMGLMLLNSCEAESSHKDLNLAAEHQMGNKKVKSILLYHEIGGFSNDSISAVLDDINSVIHTIDPQSNGYSLWQVQSDTIENIVFSRLSSSLFSNIFFFWRFAAAAILLALQMFSLLFSSRLQARSKF